MTLLISTALIVLVVSFFCSLVELAVHAVCMPCIRGLVESGRREGRLLADFKEHMERPVSAILILNTVANTTDIFEAILGRPIKIEKATTAQSEIRN